MNQRCIYWAKFGYIGDTINLRGTSYRLWSSDAPESKQSCNGWQAGKASSEYLNGLLRGRTVSCKAKTKSRYGRTVAPCTADGRDLGADMVSAGMAFAFTRYSADYASQEEAVRSAGRGMDAHGCEMPWDWRKHK